VQALGFRGGDHGKRTGGDEPVWQTIHNSPGGPDIWQLLGALRNHAAQDAPEKFIANPGERSGGCVIRLTVHPDGSFAIPSSRTGRQKSYR
jgi:hypothetical protein